MSLSVEAKHFVYMYDHFERQRSEKRHCRYVVHVKTERWSYHNNTLEISMMQTFTYFAYIKRKLQLISLQYNINIITTYMYWSLWTGTHRHDAP